MDDGQGRAGEQLLRCPRGNLELPTRTATTLQMLVKELLELERI